MIEKTTLEKILADPESTAEERGLAERELAAMGEGPSPTDQAGRSAASPLVAELLRFTGASSLAEVNQDDVYRFLDGRQPYQRETLFQEFTAYKIEVQRDPVYVAGNLEVGRRLHTYFLERLDGIMARLRAAIDAGANTQAIRGEIREFLSDWKDSGALSEETKAGMRGILERMK